jgi:single-strand DNA-binding protein
MRDCSLSEHQHPDTHTCSVRVLFLPTTPMRSVNKVILVGHLAADPEILAMPNGARTTFPVATHREFTSDGVPKQVTDYHRVVAWGTLAEVCMKFLTKGQGIYVEGMLLNRAYEKDGERKYVTEIRADEINVLTYKKRSGVTTVSIEKPTPQTT